jgi:hypothetical protein
MGLEKSMSEEKKEVKPKLVNTDVTFETKTSAELQAQLDAVDLEIKQYDLILKRDQAAKIQAQYNQRKEEARTRAEAIKNYMRQRDIAQQNCNHRKGGIGAEAFLTGQGDAAQHSIVKHKLPHNQYMVLCTRCGKEWHPGIAKLGLVETPGYQEALRYNTDNIASGSSSFTFEVTQGA